MLQPKDIVSGYELLEMLDSNAAGETWRAGKQTEEESQSVLLRLIRLPAANTENLDALRAKAEELTALWPYPYLWPYLTVEVEVLAGQNYLVLARAFTNDESLAQRLAKGDGEAWVEADAVRLMDGILQGLEALHTGQPHSFIHGALTPSKIILEGMLPRLADFAVTGWLTDRKTTGTDESFDYQAPEVWDGNYTAAADIWSAGVIFYQLLTGVLPFQRSSPRAAMLAILTQEPTPWPAAVTPELRALVERALEKAPEARFTSAAEMRQALAVYEAARQQEAEAAEAQAAALLQARVTELQAEVARLRHLAEAREVSHIEPLAPLEDLPSILTPMPPPEDLTSPKFISRDSGPLRQVEPLPYMTGLALNSQSPRKFSYKYAKVLLIVLLAGGIGSIIAKTIVNRAVTPAPAAIVAAPTPEVGAVPGSEANDVPSVAVNQPERAGNPIQVRAQNLPGGEMKLVRIPRRLLMPLPAQRGARTNNDKTDVYLGETEMTRQIWSAVAQLPKVKQDLSPAPWQVRSAKAPAAVKDCADCPVQNVSWEDVQEFLARLNALPDNEFIYRLPTTTEWEAGCVNCNLLPGANIKGRGANKAQSVIQPGTDNKLGLFNMFGNVWEWCQDEVANDEDRRIIRGGSFKRLDAWDSTEEMDESYTDGGFRLAASLK